MDRIRGSLHPRLLPLAGFLLGFLVFYREPVFSGLTRLTGDDGDARLVAWLLEHGFRWLTEGGDLRSPPMFYPATGTLAFSDAFLLYQIFYTPIRLLGTEPLVASQLTLFALSALGFAALFHLLNRQLGVRPLFATAAAMSFCFGNVMHVTLDHAQLAAVNFLPGIACLAVAWAQAAERPAARRLPFLLAASVITGLLLSTAFYVGWFAILLAGFIGLFYFMRPDPRLRRLLREKGRQLAVDLGLAGLAFLIAIQPFFWIYGIMLRGGAHRDPDLVRRYMPLVTDLVNYGRDNLVWSRLAGALPGFPLARLDDDEARLGLTPLLMLTAIVLALRLRHTERGLTAILAGTALVCLSTINFGGWSLWWLFWRIIPGASAMRAVYRVQVVDALFVVIVAFVALERIAAGLPQGAVWRRRLLGVLAVAIVVEQINLGQVALIDRDAERRLLATAAPVPAACRSLYVTDSGDAVRPGPSWQMDAMMIAQQYRLPALNGWSGWAPGGWRFEDPHDPDYLKDVRSWIAANDLGRASCGFDLTTKRWTVPEALVPAPSIP
jgi:hypothetical protein